MRVTVSTFVGSIVDPALGADAIVNASNPQVALGSGVSGAIREACGAHTFQQVVRDRWAEEFDEPLRPGDCLVTNAGSATGFRWVLHVPAVDYRVRDPETGGPSGPSRVTACVESLLAEVVELAGSAPWSIGRPFVLGLPLLGAGAGGLGEVASIRAMLRGLDRWDAASAPESLVLDLRFAVLSDHTAELVRGAASLR